VWLNGYDENRQPLTPAQALEDISHEHARKTVTIDPHPHASVQATSLHPCQHGACAQPLVRSEVAAGCYLVEQGPGRIGAYTSARLSSICIVEGLVVVTASHRHVWGFEPLA
jgi:hypothetical protein